MGSTLRRAASPRRAADPTPPPPRRARRGILAASLAVLLSAGAVTGVLSSDVADQLAGDPAPVAAPRPTPDAEFSPEAARAAVREARDAAPAPAMGLVEVAGVPEPCSINLPLTDSMSAAEISDQAAQQWGLALTGPQWRDDRYRDVVALFAETVDSVDCTDFMNRVKAGNGGGLEVSSLPTNSWAWGDYGLTRPRVLTLDFEKFRQGYADGERGRLVRLVIHEMAHSLNADRHADPAYWRSFNRVWAAHGAVSDYGSSPTESFADAVGYYVARCAADNPYETDRHRAYYDYVRDEIFGGREFGPAAGTPQHCAVKGR